MFKNQKYVSPVSNPVQWLVTPILLTLTCNQLDNFQVTTIKKIFYSILYIFMFYSVQH